MTPVQVPPSESSVFQQCLFRSRCSIPKNIQSPGMCNIRAFPTMSNEFQLVQTSSNFNDCQLQGLDCQCPGMPSRSRTASLQDCQSPGLQVSRIANLQDCKLPGLHCQSPGLPISMIAHLHDYKSPGGQFPGLPNLQNSQSQDCQYQGLPSRNIQETQGKQTRR